MAADKERNFGSFKDLQRALGGSGEPEPPPEEAQAPIIPEGYEEWAGSARSVREIVAALGESFGPMEHGPACYRDEESEEMELLASFRIRTVFPPAVQAEVSGLPLDPDPKDFEGRVDLRAERIFTIDGEDAKDFDDAIAIRPLEDGGYELGVHIADVSHYVRPGTALDTEALARGTSVYVPDQVVPMLPEALSNHLCSLVPHRDRLAFSVIMDFDAQGTMGPTRLHKSVIRSVHRCTYRVVQKLLDGIDDEETRALAPIAEDLRHFKAWTEKQQQLRDRKGSLRLQSSERKFGFDPKTHEVARIYPSETYFSQALIEETALAANQAVGNFFRERKLPAIYRIHPEKDREELESVAKTLSLYGIRVPDKDRLTGRDVGRLIREARRRPNAPALISRIMGLVERAVYEVVQPGEEAPHWGLAREHYLHFTSPIRRYPDLIVHRWLHDVMTRREKAVEELLHPEQVADLCDVAGRCSSQAELAAMVETAIGDLKVCQYMEKHVGTVLRAVIQRVSLFGMEVFFREHYVTGFLPARNLDGRKKVEGPELTVSSRQGSRVFREGELIEVRIAAVDFVRLEVLLELHDPKQKLRR